MWHRWLQSILVILSAIYLLSTTENSTSITSTSTIVTTMDADAVTDRSSRIQVETDILPIGNSHKNAVISIVLNNNNNNNSSNGTVLLSINRHDDSNNSISSGLSRSNSLTVGSVNSSLVASIVGDAENSLESNFLAASALPSRHSIARGPFFEDGSEPFNVTSKLGSTVFIDCRIGLLYDKTVTWLRRKADSIHLLTVGRHSYSVDQRISLSFRYPNNWRLQIASVTRRDDGLYECQIATHPPIVKYIFLKVLAPEVKILDEKSRLVTERYYKAGSTVRLSCIAKQAEGNPSDSIVWSKGNILLSVGITTNSSPGIIVSSVKIPKAQNHHSGKYTCTVDQLATASVTLHILNGELPAAIHGGSSRNVYESVTTWLMTFCSLLIINFLNYNNNNNHNNYYYHHNDNR